MLHILLIIFKIIGILLLAIFGVVFLLLLAVLLVPVRYRGDASFHGTIKGRLKITWLLHILSVQVSYEGAPDLRIRVFGKRILSGGFGKDEEEEALGTSDGKEEPDDKEDPDGREVILSAQELPPVAGETKAKQQTAAPAGEVWRDTSGEAPTPERKKKFVSMIETIGSRFREGKAKLEKAGELYQQAADFLAQEDNQRTFHLLKRQIGKLLRHLSPRRLKGELTFGLEDPYMMGQIVSAAAFLYPVIRDRIRFTPVFDEKVIDGELSLRGRVRVGTLVWIAARVLLDRNFRKLLRKILNRGGN